MPSRVVTCGRLRTSHQRFVGTESMIGMTSDQVASPQFHAFWRFYSCCMAIRSSRIRSLPALQFFFIYCSFLKSFFAVNGGLHCILGCALTRLMLVYLFLCITLDSLTQACTVFKSMHLGNPPISTHYIIIVFICEINGRDIVQPG